MIEPQSQSQLQSHIGTEIEATIENSSVTNNFKDERISIMKTTLVNAIGIDISHGQNVNWNQLKAEGYDFAIIKASHGYPGVTPEDIAKDNAFKEYFKENAIAAKQAGLLVGAYHLVTARNLQTGTSADNFSVETQANMFLDVVDYAGGFYNVKLPLCIDIEDNIQTTYTTMESGLVNSIAKAFALAISKRGYVPCLYFNRQFKNFVYGSNMSQFGIMPLWYARLISNVTEEEALNEVPNMMFWQIGEYDVPAATWPITGSHNTDIDNCFKQLYPSVSPTVAVYDLFQTKTGSSVYINYCTNTLYAPIDYTNEQILSAIRDNPIPSRWYIIENNNLVLTDRNMASHASIPIMRYTPYT